MIAQLLKHLPTIQNCPWVQVSPEAAHNVLGVIHTTLYCEFRRFFVHVVNVHLSGLVYISSNRNIFPCALQMQEVKLLVEGLQSGTGGTDSTIAEVPPTVSCHPPHISAKKLISSILHEINKETHKAIQYNTMQLTEVQNMYTYVQLLIISVYGVGLRVLSSLLKVYNCLVSLYALHWRVYLCL